jgi:hypothetical protein
VRLRRIDLLFVLGALAVVIGVSLLPSPRDRNPMIPATSDHRNLRSEADCLSCHAPGGSRPLPARHPKRPDCFHCHRAADGESLGR